MVIAMYLIASAQNGLIRANKREAGGMQRSNNGWEQLKLSSVTIQCPALEVSPAWSKGDPAPSKGQYPCSGLGTVVQLELVKCR